MKSVELLVNGSPRRVDADPGASLLGVLRDDLDLTGTKYGCGEGMCGACTVLVDGRAVRSCQTPAAEAAGARITTIEGLATGERLHPLQEAFLAEEAMQCGFCDPGMIMSGVALLERNPDPSRDEIVAAMDGNLCRCGTYSRVVAAVRRAADAAKQKKEAAR
jgi:aerobic-type carbon monoxide dehydrogenase small subunit (CoxS/CutS family)